MSAISVQTDEVPIYRPKNNATVVTESQIHLRERPELQNPSYHAPVMVSPLKGAHDSKLTQDSHGSVCIKKAIGTSGLHEPSIVLGRRPIFTRVPDIHTRQAALFAIVTPLIESSRVSRKTYS